MKKVKSILAVKLAALLCACGFAFSAWAEQNFYKDSADANLWHVANLAGLEEFRNSVNSGTDYSGMTVVLDDNIDLSSVDNWTPIGDTSAHAFKGVFNGADHTISHLTITGDGTYKGLFGYVGGGTTTIKNVNLASVTVSGKKRIAGLAAEVIGDATFIDCAIDASSTITGTESNIAGLISEIYPTANSTVTCTRLINRATVTGTGGAANTCRVAGVCCQTTNGNGVVVDVTFTDCQNYGVITSEGAYAGGITCAVQGPSSIETFDNCSNSGTLNGVYTGDLNSFFTGDKHSINIVNHSGDLTKAICTLQHGNHGNVYYVTVEGVLYMYQCVRGEPTVNFGDLYANATPINSKLLDDFRSFAAYVIAHDDLHRSAATRGSSGTSTDKEIFYNAMYPSVNAHGDLISHETSTPPDYITPEYGLSHYNADNGTSFDASYFRTGWTSDTLYKVVSDFTVTFQMTDSVGKIVIQGLDDNVHQNVFDTWNDGVNNRPDIRIAFTQTVESGGTATKPTNTPYYDYNLTQPNNGNPKNFTNDDSHTYTFDGWATSDGALYDFTTPVTENLTLHPRFSTTGATILINNETELRTFAREVELGRKFREQWGYGQQTVKLANDITLTSNWTPVDGFEGIFDGDNHSISGLMISATGDYAGFFSGLNSHTVVKDLTFVSPTVTSTDEYVGVLAGSASSNSSSTQPQVSNVNITGAFSVSGQNNVGALIGQVNAGVSITDCDIEGASGTVTATDSDGRCVGGLLGNTIGEVSVTDCSVSGVTVTGYRKIGGLIGQVQGRLTCTDVCVSNVTLHTNATTDYANTLTMGGLVGIFPSSYSGSTFSGTVSNLTMTGPANIAESKKDKYIMGWATGGTGDVIPTAETNMSSMTFDVTVSGTNTRTKDNDSTYAGINGTAAAPADPVVTFLLRDAVGDMTISYDSSVYTMYTQDGVQRSGAAVYNYMTQTVANGGTATEPAGEPSYWYHSGKTFPEGNNDGIPFSVEQSQAYVFDGWRLSGTDVRYDFTTPVTSDITLVPHFSAVEAVFEIYTEADLIAFAREVTLGRSYRSEWGGFPRQTVKLMNNITLTSNWTPIPGRFHGVFDGNGYAISGLVINDTTNTETGFFRTSGKSGNSFVIKDLTFQNPQVTSSGSYVGVLVGQADCVAITNVTVNTPTVLSTSTDNVGGLVGSVNNNMTDNVAAYVSTFSGCSVNGGTISCTGTDGRIVGGLIGQGLRYLTITDCTVSNVTINGYRKLGGLIGQANDAYLTCTDASVSRVTLNALGNTSYANHLTMGGLVGQFATPRQSTITGTVSDLTMTGPESIASGWNYIMGLVSGGTAGTVEKAETAMSAANMTFDVTVSGTNTTTINTDSTYAGINGNPSVTYVAQIIRNADVFAQYETLKDAIDAAVSGDTIELLNNIQVSGAETVGINKVGTYVIDGKGFAITPAADSAYVYHRFKFGESGQAYDATRNFIVTNLTITGFDNSTYFIRSEGCCVTFADCYITNNIITNVENFTSVMLATHADLTIDGCVFKDNVSYKDIVNFNSNADGDGTNSIVVNNCLFLDNTGSGNAVIMIAEDSTASVTDSTFDGNAVNAVNNGAVVYFGDVGGDCTGCLFKDNIINYTVSDVTKYGNRVRAAGAVFTWANGENPGTISGNAFVNNSVVKQNANFLTCYAKAIYSGGYYNPQDLAGNYFGGSAPVIGQADITTANNDIYAEYDSKAVTASTYATAYTPNANDRGVTVTLYVPPVAQIIRNDAVVSSYATLADAIEAAQSGDTVKLLADVELAKDVHVTSSGEIIYCVLVDGVYKYQVNAPQLASLTIDGGNHTISMAANAEFGDKYHLTGGAAFFFGRYDNVDGEALAGNYTFKNVTFTGFTSTVVYARGCALTIDNCTFDQNNITTAANGISQALIYYSPANLTVRNSTFTANSIASGRALVEGAGSRADGPIVIDNNLFESNTSNDAHGLIYLSSAAVSSSSDSISNNTFKDNTISKNDGTAVVYLSGPVEQISGNLFTGNSITATGANKKEGVIILGSGATGTVVNNNAFVNNTLGTTASHYATIYTSANCDISGNYWGDGNAAEIEDHKDVYDSGSHTIANATYATAYTIVGKGVTVTLAAQNFYQDSEDANLWHVANLAGLKEFRDSVNAGNNYEGKTVVLDADIDLSLDVDEDSQRISWVPIGLGNVSNQRDSTIYFGGVFDGTGKTISNLKINDSNLAGAGLFGVAKSTGNGGIRNITLTNVNITAKSWIGSLVGCSWNSKLTNCHVTGTIALDGHYMMGGLAGQSYSDFENCSVDGTSKTTSHVIATYLGNDLEADKVGGITGHWKDAFAPGRMINCSVSNLSVAGSRDVGGIIGLNRYYDILEDCSASDIIVTANTPLDYAESKSSKIHIGGAIGSFQTGTGMTGSVEVTVQNIDLRVTTPGVESIAKMGYVSGGAYGVHPLSAPSNVTNAGIVVTGTNSSQGIQSCNNVFVQAPGVPVATVTISGVATNYGDLHDALEAGKAKGAVVTLLKDVDLAGVNWVPVGDATAFNGTFDGQNHIIRNLTGSGTTNVGLFGHAVGATIRNVTISNVTFTASSSHVGALIGHGDCFTASNCVVIGTINISGYSNAGGLVGTASNAQWAFRDCLVDGTSANSSTVSSSNMVGGLVGNTDYEGVVSDCTVKNVTVRGPKKVGGLIGQFNYDNDANHNDTSDLVSVSGTKVESVTVDCNATAQTDDYVQIGGLFGILYRADSASDFASVSITATVKNVTVNGIEESTKGAANAGIVSGGYRKKKVADSQTQLAGDNVVFNITFEGTNAVTGNTNYSDYVGIYNPSPYVAQIIRNNEILAQYATLAEAISEAQNGDTVVLLADVDLKTTGLVIAADKNFTLDIGEYNITGTVNGKLITNNGMLVINGTTGCVYNQDISAQGHDALLNNGTVTINGGWFGDSDNDKTNANAFNRGAGFRNFGTATINGGHFTACDNFTNGGYAYAIINGDGDNNPTLTINNADVYGKNNGNLANNSGTITVKGGTYDISGTKSYYSLYSYSGNTVVVGGTFTKSGNNNGQFCVEVDNDNVNNPGSIAVSGGSFSAAVPATYCAEGVLPVSEADPVTDLYTVRAANYVAQIVGGAKFESFAAAVESVQNDDTIVLLSDTTVATGYAKRIGESGYGEGVGANRLVISTDKTFTVDLGGHVLMGRINFARGNMTLINGTVRASSQALNIFGTKDYAYAGQEYSVITVGADATVEANYALCIFAGDPNYTYYPIGFGEVFNVYGKIKANSPVYVSGNVGMDTYVANCGTLADVEALKESTSKGVSELMSLYGPTINIYDGAELIANPSSAASDSSQGVSLSGCAIVNVFGGKITGAEGVGIKGGILNVSGGTITGTGAKCDPVQAVSSGTESSGAAISASTNYNANYPIEINVTGGIIKSVNNAALLVAHSVKSGTPVKAVNGIGASIGGGSFIGGATEEAVIIESALEGEDDLYPEKFISGGYFSTKVPAGYCATGYVPTTRQAANGLYTVTTPATVTYTLAEGAPAGAVRPAPASFTYPSGDLAEIALAVATCTDNGYTFGGWQMTVDDETKVVSALPAGTIGDVTLVATWKPVTKIEINIAVPTQEEPETVEIKVTDEWVEANLEKAAEEATTTEIQTALTNTQANGYTGLENYLLGLDGKTATAKVKVDSEQGASETAMPVKNTLAEKVQTADTGFTVKYSLDKVDAQSGETVAGGAGEKQDTSDLELNLKAATSGDSNVAYYKMTATITKTVTKDEETTEVEVSTIHSENTIGVLAVKEAPATAIIGVPWSSSTDSKSISVNDLVRTANLTPGDEMKVYDPATKTYKMWELNEDKEWEPVSTSSGSGISDPGEAEYNSVARGAGVWLTRQNPDEPIYLVGQATTEAATTSLEKAADEETPSWNLVASPKVEPVDIAAVTGVAESATIVVPTASAPKIYTYKQGEGWGYEGVKSTRQITLPDGTVATSAKIGHVTTDTKLPVGTGFWYINKDTTEGKKLEWDAQSSQEQESQD